MEKAGDKTKTEYRLEGNDAGRNRNQALFKDVPIWSAMTASDYADDTHDGTSGQKEGEQYSQYKNYSLRHCQHSDYSPGPRSYCPDKYWMAAKIAGSFVHRILVKFT